MDANRQDGNSSRQGERISFSPSPPDTKTVFRELIVSELCAGRLTRSGRARIVRYSSRIGLTAVEAGQLITQCAKEALEDVDPEVKQLAFQLTTPPPLKVFWSTSVITIAGGLAIIVVWAVLKSWL